ncbi:MAG: hypothetical protein AVDCRST_MAG64-1099 [uncultured Phycisphaerae bacterium]|uniref:STAS domain-containing protein n=1 Tax=uncultured Phycisphaerae bacterium TaxID=904963 RepID=A0A6J4NJ18_9BACT|nr:MAG: hypothetical protein AVDCRST_MAG64-1099 [uncultured Phycisphaerae bacterium]
MSDSPVQVAATAAGGCVVQVVGRATMHHSRAAEELVVQTLGRDPAAAVAIDLSGCTHLDSTFLGSVVGLYQRFNLRAGGDAATDHGAGAPPRLTVHAPPETVKALFGALRLDKIIRADPGPPPAVAGPWVPLDPAPPDPRELSRHVMACHRRLAAADTPARAAFAKIADAMEQELARG